MRTPEEYLNLFHEDLGLHTGYGTSDDALLDQEGEFLARFADGYFTGVLHASTLGWMRVNGPTKFVIGNFYDLGGCIFDFETLSAMRTFYKGI